MEWDFFQLQDDAVDVCGMSILEVMGIANLCVLSCLILPLCDWQCQTLWLLKLLEHTCIPKKRKNSNHSGFSVRFFYSLKKILTWKMNVFVLPCIVSYVLCCSKEIREMTLCSSTSHWIPHSHSHNVALQHFSTTQGSSLTLNYGVCSLVPSKCASLFLEN